MRRSPHGRRALGTFALIAMVAAGAPGQKGEAYLQGLEAVSREDWPAVEVLMQQAIADRPEARVRRRQTYIPYYYVGLARFRQGDCAGADEWWTRSQQQGIVSELEQQASIERGREACRREAERVEQLTRGRALLRETTVTAASLLDLARRDGTRDIWSLGDPSPEDRHAGAMKLISIARDLLGDDAGAAAMREAQDLLAEAEGAFAALRRDVAERTEEWGDALGEQRDAVAGLATEARSLMASTSHLSSVSRAIRGARADLEGLIGEAERMRPDPTPEYLEGLTARLSHSLEELESVSDGPPPSLQRAAESFLAGDYAAVVGRLGEAELGDRRSRAHAHMLLAASRYVLFLEGGEIDRELLEAAVADVRACYAASSALRPEPRIFSPSFVSFFEEHRAARAAARS